MDLASLCEALHRVLVAVTNGCLHMSRYRGSDEDAVPCLEVGFVG